ncbi:MAG: hypothetical protein KAY22_05950 [Rhizorhabdus sp.]|uniref:hypothetical protein n=1 Tax=Rhizorhabdus sp. TaxID=1968843 RepID=UPI001B4BB1F8|nr:hypothetical protein [Rhizorhabdus sp.]MBP8231829.1 hypothetical protein [Rhizorhabdus sp.]
MTLSALRARPAPGARPQKSQTMPSIEADMAYYRRRAAESAERALIASNPGARLAHEELAKLYRGRLAALEAELRERR